MDLLSADILDDDFIKIFRPIFLLQRLLGILRVDIRFKFATAPSIWYQFYSSIVSVAIVASILDYLLNCELAFDSSFANSTLKIGVIMNGLSSAITIWRNNVYNRNVNSELFVKLQRIQRELNAENTKSLNKGLSNLTAVTSVTICILIALWIFVFNIWIIKLCPTAILIVFASTGNYIEIEMVGAIMYFINIQVGNINSALQRKTIANKILKQSLGGRSPVLAKYLGISNDIEDTPDATVRAVHTVLDSMSNFIDLYQFPIFSFICQMFIWNMVTVQNLIVSIKKQYLEHSQSQIDFNLMIIITPAIILMLLVTLTLCFLAEGLSLQLQKVRKLCIDIISSQNRGKSRTNAKRIILLVDSKRNVSIYSMYTLGAKLPLHLFAITASYTIVLLQFALL